MIEAVENHMPQVIIIDEIGTELEVLAARTIAEKGVQLVGTTHGNSLENLIKNPSLSDLIGGIQYVTLSDEEANRRGTQKSILERKASPTFEIIIEINKTNVWIIHENVKASIDDILRENLKVRQFRKLSLIEKLKIKSQKSLHYQVFLKPTFTKIVTSRNHSWTNVNKKPLEKFTIKRKSRDLIIYSYSLSNNFLKETFSKMGVKFVLTNDIKKASLIVTLKKHLKQNLKLKKLAKKKKIPIYSLNQLSLYQLTKFIKSLTLNNFY
jgi:hypothetical protein